jgi:hypothetical protein
MLATEIERLNSCLRDKSRELNEQTVRSKQLEDERKYIEELNAELEGKIKRQLADIGSLEQQNR